MIESKTKNKKTLVITDESQARLTVELKGRIATLGCNSSRRERKKAARTIKHGGKWFAHYEPYTVQECKQTTNINTESVQFFISDEGKPSRVSLSDWKKMSPVERLEVNFQIQANYLSGYEHTKFSYEILN